MAFIDNSKLMMDTALVALKCGLTPVATLMLDGAFLGFVVPHGPVRRVAGRTEGADWAKAWCPRAPR